MTRSSGCLAATTDMDSWCIDVTLVMIFFATFVSFVWKRHGVSHTLPFRTVQFKDMKFKWICVGLFTLRHRTQASNNELASTEVSRQGGVAASVACKWTWLPGNRAAIHSSVGSNVTISSSSSSSSSKDSLLRSAGQ